MGKRQTKRDEVVKGGQEKFASSHLAGSMRQEITTPEEYNQWPIAVPCKKEKYNPYPCSSMQTAWLQMKSERISLKRRKKEKTKKKKIAITPRNVLGQNKKLDQRHADDRTKRTAKVQVKVDTGSVDFYGFFLTWLSQSSSSPATKSSPSKTRERRRIEKLPQDRYIPTNQAAMILPIWWRR